MLKKLILNAVTVFTVNSSDDEYRSSDKGRYKDRLIANTRTKGVGWYGSDGTVVTLKDTYQDENGILYQVKELGAYDDDRIAAIEAAKAKLTPSERELLGIKD